MSTVDPNPPVTKDDTLADDPWTDEPDGSPGEPDTTLVVGLLGKGTLSLDTANESFGLEPTSHAEVDGANVETDGVYVSGYPLGDEEDDATNPETITSNTDTGAEQINYTGTTDGANADATVVPDETDGAYGESSAEADLPYLANTPGAKEPDIDDSGPDQFFGATQDTPPNVELTTLSMSGGAGTLPANYGEVTVDSGESLAQFGQPNDTPGELDTTNTSIATTIPANNGIPLAIPDSYVLTDIDTLYGYPGLTAGVGDSDPAAPTNVAWTFGPGKAFVSWDAADTLLAAPVQANLVLTTSDSGTFSGTGNEFYVVTALNGEGETTASNEKSVNVAATTDSVTVSWAAVAGATGGYNIYRGTSTGAEGHLVGHVAQGTLSYKDHGSTGTAQSPPVSNTTSTEVAAPTITATLATTGGDLPGDETYYYVVTATNEYGETTESNEVFVGSFALLTPPVVGGTPTVTTADSGTFASATEYFYKVTAVNADGESLGSNEVNATIGATTSSITLAWAAVAEAVSYNIYRGTVTNTENHLVGNTSALTYKDHGAVGTAQSPPVSAPGLTNTNAVTVSWTEVHGATGYNIYRGKTSGVEDVLVGQVGVASSFVDAGDPTGSAIPVAQTPPEINTTQQGAGAGPVREYLIYGYQVKDASFIPTDDTTALNYQRTVEAHAHGLVRDNADGSQTVEVVPTQVEIEHLTPGDFYFFRVQARNDTSSSALSTMVGVTPPTEPATPYYYYSAGALDGTVVDIPAYDEPEGASLDDLTFTGETGIDELGDANSGEDGDELARTGEEAEGRI